MSASDIHSQTLQLNGVFARLQAGKYNVNQAVTEALNIADNIDKIADTMEGQTTGVRKQVASFAKTNYGLNQEIVRLKAKNEALEKELKLCKADLSQYSDFFSEEEKELSFTTSEPEKKQAESKKELSFTSSEPEKKKPKSDKELCSTSSEPEKKQPESKKELSFTASEPEKKKPKSDKELCFTSSEPEKKKLESDKELSFTSSEPEKKKP